MINIRVGVFETNSSSVHSMVICTVDDYNAWINGEKLYNVYYEDRWADETGEESTPAFVTPEEAAQYDPYYPYPKCEEGTWGWELDFKDENGKWHTRNFITFEEFENSYGYDFETFDQSFITPGGEEVIAFGYYGRDG